MVFVVSRADEIELEIHILRKKSLYYDFGFIFTGPDVKLYPIRYT